MFGWFSNKKEKNKQGNLITPAYIVINVDNFNLWFNHPDNGATYAHPGIFLRLDKLSTNHIVEYMEKCYGINGYNVPSEEYDVQNFMDIIRKDWIKKINENENK